MRIHSAEQDNVKIEFYSSELQLLARACEQARADSVAEKTVLEAWSVAFEAAGFAAYCLENVSSELEEITTLAVFRQGSEPDKADA